MAELGEHMHIFIIPKAGVEQKEWQYLAQSCVIGESIPEIRDHLFEQQLRCYSSNTLLDHIACCPKILEFLCNYWIIATVHKHRKSIVYKTLGRFNCTDRIW